MAWEPSRLHQRLAHLRPTFPIVGVREEGGGGEAGPREGTRRRNTKKKQTRRRRRTMRTILQTKKIPCACCARRHRRKAHRKRRKKHAPACETTRNNGKRGRGGHVFHTHMHIPRYCILKFKRHERPKNRPRTHISRNRTRKPRKRTLNYHFERNRALKVPQRKRKQGKEGGADRKVRPLSLSPTKKTRNLRSPARLGRRCYVSKNTPTRSSSPRHTAPYIQYSTSQALRVATTGTVRATSLTL